MRTLVILLMGLILVQSAFSLICIGLTPEDRIANYTDVAFIGTVLDVDGKMLEMGMDKTIEIDFEVSEVLKGEVPDRVVVVQHCWSGCGEREGQYLVMAQYVDGKPTLGWCDFLTDMENADQYLTVFRNRTYEPEPTEAIPPEPKEEPEVVIADSPEEPPSIDNPDRSLFSRFLDWLTFWN